MASEVDICNLALGYLGDVANIISLNEGSPQAMHCARFYPIARDGLLDMHAWTFASRRATLAVLGSAWPEWTYKYMPPNDMLTPIAILPQSATDDYSVASPVAGKAVYQPQPFALEYDENGVQVIYSDQENAVLRYTAYITDTTMFSPLFVTALSWHLASMLAGSLIKGDVGIQEAKRCTGMMSTFVAQATASDANAGREVVAHAVPWMQAR